MAVYLEEYLESVENLPHELKYHLNEIRSRDEQFHSIRKQVSELQKNLLADGNNEETVRPKLKDKFDSLKRISEEKILLGEKLVELIGKHISRLDDQITVASRNVDDSALAILLEDTSTQPQQRRKRRSAAYVHETEEEDETDDFIEQEETYCTCQRPSFGEMVMCDNEEKCPYVWFHIGCVGLSAPPVGTWYCPTCAPKMKKRTL